MITILSGVSGSGKSLYAKMRILAEEGARIRRIFSTDDFFRADGSYDFNVAKLGYAHNACFRSYIEMLRECSTAADLYVDNTNTTEAEIAPYYAAGLAYGHEVHVLTFLANPVVAHARNQHGVSLSEVWAQHRRLLTRSLPPWWVEFCAPGVNLDGSLIGEES